SAGALLYARGVLDFGGSATHATPCPAVYTYNASHKQCDQVGCDGSTSPRADRDVGLAPPGHFMLCIVAYRNDSRTNVYEVFFVGLRLPAILDACEKQNYYPVPADEPQKNMGPK